MASQASMAQVRRLEERFPCIQVRYAQAYDLRRMARMANEVFQHERDLDYFERHRAIKMGDEHEAEAAERLLAAETEWRHAALRGARRIPGRHLIVATYMRKPADYLSGRSNSSLMREEILGWAEWQDPRFPTHPKPTAHAIATGNISHVDNLDDEQQSNEINLQGLDSVLDALTMKHEGQQLLVLPNSLATHRSFVRMAINQHAAELAANNPAIGNTWFEDIIPSCFGSLGAVNGWDLVLRSLVISPLHWHSSDGIGQILLNWGAARCIENGWTGVQTLASRINVSTADALLEAGFIELLQDGNLSRTDVFRDQQIALYWPRDRFPPMALACEIPPEAARTRTMTPRKRSEERQANFGYMKRCNILPNIQNQHHAEPAQ
ncbi:hypothetical protein VTJ04DRAFT_1264 [Mycothermus thermophilus]|uniref:uncharacterized protein n=1 Tax=Humicola insolens TaxID=85995 RepID=UPI0037431BF9